MKYRLVVLLLAFALFPVAASAEESSAAWRLDQNTVEKGYTMIFGGITVAAPSKAFTAPVRFELSALAEYPVIPSGYVLKSAVYSIGHDGKQSFLIPVVMAGEEAYPSSSVIAAYDAARKEWTSLQTSRPGKKLRASLAQNDAILAVLDPIASVRPVAQIHSDSAAVLDDATGAQIFLQHADEQRPIASLTKLATAWVFLETKPDWNKLVTYQRSDSRAGGAVSLRPGETIRVKDLFYSMIVGSANNATVALARSTGLSQAEFVKRMNEKAKSLGLTQTTFVEPSGLDVRNVSTAREYAVFARTILRKWDMLKATTTKEYRFATVNTKRIHRIRNTNELLRSKLYLTGGKTGYTDEAGYCLVLKSKDRATKRDYITVVLHADSSLHRFQDAENLASAAPEIAKSVSSASGRPFSGL